MSGEESPGEVADFVRQAATGYDSAAGPRALVRELTLEGRRRRRADRSRLFVCASVVVKLHPYGTDVVLLSERLHSITRPGVSQFWIQPLRALPMPAPRGQLATIWPRVDVLAPTDEPPWMRLGALLARLHQTPPSQSGCTPSGAPARLARAITYLREHANDDFTWLADFGDDLTRQLLRPGRTTLIHGDLHLGQLGRPVGGSWKLLDPDDTGLGDPAWDLARPAGLWAAGFLGDRSWNAFITAYQDADGPAVQPTGDPWTTLDLPAQAAILIATVQALRTAAPLAATRGLVDACRRMSGH